MINEDDFISMEDEFLDLDAEELAIDETQHRTARWRLESLLEEKRLRDELEDFLDY